MSLAVGDQREAFRTTELRLRLLLLGDGSESPGLVKGEEPRRRVSAELRHLREAFAARAEADAGLAATAAQVADLEQELLRLAAQQSATGSLRVVETTLLTPAECAAALRVSVRSVYRAVERGELRGVKPTGGKRGALRIPVSEVERLLADDPANAASVEP